MKFLVVLAAALACATADLPPEIKPDEALAPVVRSDYNINADGNGFQFAYETGNGISAQSDGVVKNPESETPALEIKGSYSYTAPDGTVVNLQYLADEKGFQPIGSHIPVPPPIPEYILRGLQYIESHPPPAETVNKP